MSNRTIFLLSLSSILLQGCLSVYTEDFIRKSESRLTPIGGSVHIPAADTATRVQASFSLAGGPDGDWGGAVVAGGPVDDGSTAKGTSNLAVDNLRFGTEWSLVYRRWLRLGVGATGSTHGGGAWVVTGIATPGSWPLEAYVEAGVSGLSYKVDWKSVTYRRDPEDGLNDSTVVYSTQAASEFKPSERLGLHFGRRAGGPWIEAVAGYQELFDSPNTEATWETMSLELAAGWMVRSKYGIVTAYVRSRRFGRDVWPPALRLDEWNPSAGIQWTAEVPLGR